MQKQCFKCRAYTPKSDGTAKCAYCQGCGWYITGTPKADTRKTCEVCLGTGITPCAPKSEQVIRCFGSKCYYREGNNGLSSGMLACPGCEDCREDAPKSEAGEKDDAEELYCVYEKGWQVADPHNDEGRERLGVAAVAKYIRAQDAALLKQLGEALGFLKKHAEVNTVLQGRLSAKKGVHLADAALAALEKRMKP